jgi:tRNA pseudouridine38-40 synthase
LRYFLDIAYNGKPYHGFQRQPEDISVQEVLEDAMAIFFQKAITIFGAGRTDTGVHGKQLLAHFDVDNALDEPQFLYKLNKLLPESVAVQDIYRVNNEAHARFDAMEREYEYVVTTRKDPFLAENALYIIKPLNVDAMNIAAKILLEYTDFECFSKVKTDVKTFNCKIEYAHWSQHEHKLVFTIRADRFLRNMVRAIVGTLLEVGLGKRSPESLHEIIASKNRGEAGKSVAAQGLYLTKVLYPDCIKDLSLTRKEFTYN